jgi:serine/threonine protein kinase
VCNDDDDDDDGFWVSAIDIWSVGVTLLCFLTRRFPFFNSNDDVDALMEIATIFGRSKLEGVAIHHSCVIHFRVDILAL